MKFRCSFVVGNRWRVLFLKDRWCGDNLLCVLYPSLFALLISKDAWVVNVWNSCFFRSFNDWEVDCVARFLTCL